MKENKLNNCIGEPELENPSFKWLIRLYIAGTTTRSAIAIKNLSDICHNELKGKCNFEVVDLLKDPESGSNDQILAIPTLVRKYPEPEIKIIGDLSEKQKVLSKLDLLDYNLPEG